MPRTTPILDTNTYASTDPQTVKDHRDDHITTARPQETPEDHPETAAKKLSLQLLAHSETWLAPLDRESINFPAASAFKETQTVSRIPESLAACLAMDRNSLSEERMFTIRETLTTQIMPADPQTVKQ